MVAFTLVTCPARSRFKRTTGEGLPGLFKGHFNFFQGTAPVCAVQTGIEAVLKHARVWPTTVPKFFAVLSV